jgi:4-hydroxybenzoyl-CoA reductase subunit alpha
VLLTQKSGRGKPVIGEGAFNPEDEGVLDPKELCEKGIGNYSPAYSFGTHVTEVEVDPDLGRVDVKRITVAHDCGVAINPMAVEGQLQGSVSMGQGYALTEQVVADSGLMLNPNMLDYKLPLSVDTPPIDIMLVETHDPFGPFGAKEAGEGPVSPTAPSIVNAIHQATGVWIKELPISPEKLIRRGKERQEEP